MAFIETEIDIDEKAIKRKLDGLVDDITMLEMCYKG